MNSEQIYKAALEELSTQGHAVAAFALLAGSKAEAQGTKDVGPTVNHKLMMANESLQAALRHNDREWTTSTDHRIKEAQTKIIEAIAIL